MNFVERLKSKLALLIAFIVVYLLMVIFDTTCIVKFVFGIPCPGCGLTRAWVSFFRLDFRSAFEYHPLFWTVPISLYYILYDLAPFKNKFLNYGVPITIIAMFFINWIVRLVLSI